MADSKHTVGDLRQLQALPLRLKIPLTQQRIRDWYEHWDGQVYVSFSGGVCQYRVGIPGDPAVCPGGQSREI